MGWPDAYLLRLFAGDIEELSRPLFRVDELELTAEMKNDLQNLGYAGE